MNKLQPSIPLANEKLFADICNLLQSTRKQISHSINSTIVRAYWQVGKYIVEYEQQGEQRATYGKAVITDLSKRLIAEFGNGFTATNLRYMRQFYSFFPIYHTLCDKLSWSHCRTIIKVQDETARNFYLEECVAENWSVRQLDHQINTLYYERLLASRDKKTVTDEIHKSEPKPLEPREIIRDPYILDFLGIPQGEHFLESNLEEMLINKLQRFLLELGKGYSFVARQKRITLEDDEFFVDLVFYNRLLHCFVIIELKTGKLTHQDLGQLQMYVNYYDRCEKLPNENPTIGILLGTSKNDTSVKMTLPKDNKTILANEYKLYLPTQTQLINEVNSVRLSIEMNKENDQ